MSVHLNEEALDNLRAVEEMGVAGFFQKAVNQYLSETSERIDSMHESFGEKDLREIERFAHSLKSSSATLGADDLSKMSLGLEMAARNGEAVNLEGMFRKIEEEFLRVKETLENLI